MPCIPLSAASFGRVKFAAIAADPSHRGCDRAEDRATGMKNFVYGIVFGAAMAYLYVTQGGFMGGTVASALSWRDSARGSVAGYGGPGAKRH
jgi:hypothetical protein